MAVNAGTIQSYSNTLIFEDLANAFRLLSPTECPFQQAIGADSTTNDKFEWPLVTLNAVDSANRVIEGDDAPAIDTGTLGVRLNNYTQISDKVISVSNTSEAVDASAENIQKLAKQMVYKMKEMKRDMETMLVSNVPAIPGSSGTARQTAGMPAWLRTNTSFVAGGANPTLSGTTAGYPNAAATPGTTPLALSETTFNTLIQSCWNNGGDPSMVLVNANNKRVISQTFTGNATKYKDVMDKKLMNSVDFYESDFGTLTIVPTRFLPTIAASNYILLLLDPSYIKLTTLDPVQQTDLAQTGHAKRKMLWTEYGLKVENEASCGIYRDTTGA